MVATEPGRGIADDGAELGRADRVVPRLDQPLAPAIEAGAQEDDAVVGFGRDAA